MIRLGIVSARALRLGALACAVATALPPGAEAETIAGALVRAYQANPTLNAQRASVRATDENVPRALSGYRPRLSATADAGAAYADIESAGAVSKQNLVPRGVGVQVNQNVFNGNRTANSVRQAQSQVLGARETLRNTEGNVLFDGATAYMNVLRDTAILNLQRNNIEVLEEQLRQTQQRFDVGEVTRTDIAQAQARLAASRSQASLAESNLRTSIARYRQIIGVEPRALAPGRPLERLPASLSSAISISMEEHPAIKAALHGVDAAELQIKVTEAELLPSFGLTGAVSQRYDVQTSGDNRLTASIVGQITSPRYEGGEVYARTRQAKETAGQRRIETEQVRDQVRAAVNSAWGQLEAATAQITAAEAQVAAAFS